MSEPFIGEIVLFAGNFAPRGWMFCQGQILSIAQNTALFSILGTTYGGNGQTTFALPDLRGRVPVGQGQGPGLPFVNLGEMAGTPTTTLLQINMPPHNHSTTPVSVPLNISIPANTTDGNTSTPGSTKVLANVVETTVGGTVNAYGDAPGNASLAPINTSVNLPAGTTSISGAGQPFSIQNPFTGLNYIIAVQGIFPSRN